MPPLQPSAGRIVVFETWCRASAIVLSGGEAGLDNDDDDGAGVEELGCSSRCEVDHPITASGAEVLRTGTSTSMRGNSFELPAAVNSWQSLKMMSSGWKLDGPKDETEQE